MSKTAYISPSTGELEIDVIRDATPRVVINLDLGIPNFTIFSLKFPLVTEEPKNMAVVVQEALGVLLDEVATFMLSLRFNQEVITDVYARALSCFAGMSMESSTQADYSAVGQDPTMDTYKGTFKLPQSFVQETQKRVVTGAAFVQRVPKQRVMEFVRAIPHNKNTINDAQRTIQMYKNRQLKTQPKPLYVLVYDMNGNPTGVLPVDQQWKNKLLRKIQSAQSTTFNPSLAVRNWLLDPDRIRISRDRYKPTEQDIQDVLALLDWPEHRRYTKSISAIQMGASMLLAKLRSRKSSKHASWISDMENGGIGFMLSDGTVITPTSKEYDEHDDMEHAILLKIRGFNDKKEMAKGGIRFGMSGGEGGGEFDIESGGPLTVKTLKNVMSIIDKAPIVSDAYVLYDHGKDLNMEGDKTEVLAKIRKLIQTKFAAKEKKKTSAAADEISAVLDVLKAGPKLPQDVAKILGWPHEKAYGTLQELRNTGVVGMNKMRYFISGTLGKTS